MVADGLHHGHIHVLEAAAKLGRVWVGVLTDRAVHSYKREPVIAFGDRRYIVSSIRCVTMTVAQETLDYRPNLMLYEPDFLVHGDDWCDPSSPQYATYLAARRTMEEIGGVCIDVPYTRGISTSEYLRTIRNGGDAAESGVSP
jgi:phosphoenolpyruvate phosphomutase